MAKCRRSSDKEAFGGASNAENFGADYKLQLIWEQLQLLRLDSGSR